MNNIPKVKVGIVAVRKSLGKQKKGACKGVCRQVQRRWYI